ncbi:MAG TPA: hypothetical protein VHL09_11735, partial [Dehalococcoidia bacterium]|nr:hypothetical protein [Dehalococcoidia bacterium]
SRWSRVRLPLAAVLLVSLFTINFFGNLWPQRDAGEDYWRVRVGWYERNATPADLVVTTYYKWEKYLAYFGQAQVLNVDPIFLSHGADWPGAVAEIRRLVDTAPARRVFFSSEVFYPSSDAYSRCTGTGALCQDSRLLRDEFLPRSRLVSDSPLEKVWQLDRPDR